MLLSCAVQGRWCFSRAKGSAWASPSQYTVLSPKKDLQLFCHFICWSRTAALAHPWDLPPEVAGSDLMYIFSHLPSPFHLLTAGVRGRETKKEVPGQS